MYIINLRVHTWAFSGITLDKITVPNLLLSKWEIVIPVIFGVFQLGYLIYLFF